MTIGDVLAFSGAVIATGATLWAAQVSCVVLYEQQTRRAAAYLEKEWISTVLTGVGVSVTAGLLALALLGQPNGLIKLIGWVLLAALLAHSILGAAGLSLLGAERIKKLAPRLSRLAHIQRAAGLMIAAGFLPVFGWLFIFPVAFCFALGAGWRAMTGKNRHQILAGSQTEPAHTEPVRHGIPTFPHDTSTPVNTPTVVPETTMLQTTATVGSKVER